MKALEITEPGAARLVNRPAPTPAVAELLLGIHTVDYCGTDLSA